MAKREELNADIMDRLAGGSGKKKKKKKKEPDARVTVADLQTSKAKAAAAAAAVEQPALPSEGSHFYKATKKGGVSGGSVKGQAADGARARFDADGLGAIRRINERNQDTSFRKGFLSGAAVSTLIIGLVLGVYVFTDDGQGRRIAAAQRELDRAVDLEELGDIKPAELREIEIAALLAGPDKAEDQLELATSLRERNLITDEELKQVQVAAHLAGDGEINSTTLRRAQEKGGMIAVVEEEEDGDEFTTEMRTTMSKDEVEALANETTGDRDLGIGKLARIQRQNRNIMKKAQRTAKVMTGTDGKKKEE